MTALLIAVTLAFQNQGLLRRVVPEPKGRNGYEEYLMAGEILEAPFASVYADWTPGTASAAGDSPETSALLRRLDTLPPLEVRREELSRFGKALDLVARGNAKGAFDPRVEIGPDSLFPEYSSFRRVTKLAVRAASVYAADGRTDRAVRLLLDELTFSDNIARGTLIANLVGGAMQGIVFAAMDDLLPRLSRANAVAIERWVEGLLARPPAVRTVLSAEDRMTLASLRLVFENPKEAGGLFSGEEVSMSSEERRMADEFAGMSKPVLEAVFRRLVSRLDARNRAVDRVLAGPERDWVAGVSAIADTDADAKPLTVEDALMEALAPSYMGFAAVAVRNRTQLRLLGLHAALLRYRWDTGRFPEKIEAIDPLTGGPYLYERLPDGRMRLASKGVPQTGEIELRYRRVPMEGNGSEP